MNKTEFNKERIKKLPWPDKENCFLFISGKMRKKNRFGDKFYIDAHREIEINYNSYTDFSTEPQITFAYIGESIAAEWDGHCGPIQLWFKCEKDTIIEYETICEHWIYDYAYGAGHWSQMAVDHNNLPRAFNEGNYNHIFDVLKQFVKERENKEILES